MAEPAGVVADARKSRETIAPRQCWVEGCVLPPVEVGPPTEIPMCWVHYDSSRAVDEAKPAPRKYPYPVIGNVPMDAGFPRAEVLWLVKRLERSEYERGQLKATNRRLLRRLRKLRHKRGRK